MGDTGADVLVRINALAAYVQQRALGALDTPCRARVPGDAPSQDHSGAATNRPARIQSKKMKPGPMMIAHIIQPSPAQVLRTGRIEEGRHPILPDLHIFWIGRLSQSEAVLKPSATPTCHRQPNPTGVYILLCQR